MADPVPLRRVASSGEAPEGAIPVALYGGGDGPGGAVDSVNGKTGDVILDYDDVGALPVGWMPTVSDIDAQGPRLGTTYLRGDGRWSEPSGGGGEPGADGKSAYEVAVDNGFEGTEQEWLDSLVGPQGEPGKDGAPGRDGDDGAPGAPGKDGVDGAPGKDGADGSPGADGDSAYEVAVKNGFEGSESEWLDSLIGPPGQPGEDGADGQPGRDGVDGSPGTPGRDGTDGAPGTPGQDGADGESAYQIAVRNGFIGSETDWLNLQATVIHWNSTSRTWPTRPASAPFGVTFLSTNDPTATAPNDPNLVAGDIWKAHKDAS